MKKRVVCVALAVLMSLTLCAPAYAAEGEDVFETVWDLALALQDAPCILVESDAELSTDVTGVVTMAVEADMAFTQASFQNGNVTSVAEYTCSQPDYVSDNYILVRTANGIYYMNTHYDGEVPVDAGHYASAPADAFGDLTQLPLYFAALGDNNVGASVQTDEDGDAVLTYEVDGSGLRDLLTVCFPRMTTGYEALDWSGVTATIQVEPRVSDSYKEANITVSSASLCEAMMKQMDGVEAAPGAVFTVEIEVEALAEDDSEYSEYLFTQEIQDYWTEKFGPIPEKEGDSPVIGSVKDFLWSVYEPGYSATVGREDAKNALRAQLAGGAAPAAEAPAEVPVQEAPAEETAPAGNMAG